jgi:hypothetical protein
MSGAFTYTLSRFVRAVSHFVKNNIIEYAADSKSADLRVLGVRLPSRHQLHPGELVGQFEVYGDLGLDFDGRAVQQVGFVFPLLHGVDGGVR